MSLPKFTSCPVVSFTSEGSEDNASVKGVTFYASIVNSAISDTTGRATSYLGAGVNAKGKVTHIVEWGDSDEFIRKIKQQETIGIYPRTENDGLPDGRIVARKLDKSEDLAKFANETDIPRDVKEALRKLSQGLDTGVRRVGAEAGRF